MHKKHTQERSPICRAPWVVGRSIVDGFEIEIIFVQVK